MKGRKARWKAGKGNAVEGRKDEWKVGKRSLR